MRSRPSFRTLFAALAFAGSSVLASAQITTVSLYTGSDAAFTTATARIQTFTDVTYFDSITYRFIRTSGNTPVPISYYFVEWDSNTNTAISQIAGGGLVVPIAGAFTVFNYTDTNNNPQSYFGWDYLIDLQFAANAASTYALVLLTNDPAGSDIALPTITSVDSLPNGQALYASGVSDFNDLSSVSATAFGPGVDFGFASLSIQLSPVPEPATAAAGIGALLLAGLVALRIYRRRQEEAVALAPVVAE